MLNKYEKYINHSTSAISILIPIMTLPQLFVIWGTKSAESVSLSTWSIYLLSTIIWLSYGLLHKEKRLILLNSLLIFINTGIVIGILIYK